MLLRMRDLFREAVAGATVGGCGVSFLRVHLSPEEFVLTSANHNGGTMTITRKFMFTAVIALGMLGVGSAFAQRTDNNLQWMPNYHDSFENLTAWGGVYTNIAITNGWYSDFPGGNDQSAITNMPYTFTNACGLPLPGATHTNVLQLNTQGAMLTNSFGSGFNMANAVTYMDVMVQFVASGTAPTACVTKDNSDENAGIKAAIFADVNTNLMIYHSVMNPSDGSIVSNVVEQTGIQLNATNWYRLTITFDAQSTGVGSMQMFQVALNGIVVTNANAYTNGWRYTWDNTSDYPQTNSNGTWFPSAARGQGNCKLLTAIAFQGTGYIDDLVVPTNAPTFINHLSSYLLTVVTDGNGSTDFGGTNALTSVMVSSGANTNIVFNANQWFQIASLQTNGVAVAGSVGSTNYTLALNNIQGDISNNVTFVRPTWTIAQTIGANGSGSLGSGDISMLNGANTSVTYTAVNGWYATTATPGNYGTASGNGSIAATLTFTAVQSNTTAAAVFNQVADGSVVSLVPTQWALDHGVDYAWAAANPGAMQEGYMLNLDPTTVNPGLAISGIGVSGSSVNVTVLLDNNSSPTNTTINGTLRLFATAALSNSFVEVGSVALQDAAFTNSGKHVVTFTDAKSNDFYKAEITLP